MGTLKDSIAKDTNDKSFDQLAGREKLKHTDTIDYNKPKPNSNTTTTTTTNNNNDNNAATTKKKNSSNDLDDNDDYIGPQLAGSSNTARSSGRPNVGGINEDDEDEDDQRQFGRWKDKKDRKDFRKEKGMYPFINLDPISSIRCSLLSHILYPLSSSILYPPWIPC